MKTYSRLSVYNTITCFLSKNRRKFCIFAYINKSRDELVTVSGDLVVTSTPLNVVKGWLSYKEDISSVEVVDCGRTLKINRFEVDFASI